MRLFSNEQRLIMHDRRGKLNHFIDCSENRYEVSIQRSSTMLRTGNFKARGRNEGPGPPPSPEPGSVDTCVWILENPRSPKAKHSPGCLKRLVGSSCQSSDRAERRRTGAAVKASGYNVRHTQCNRLA